MARGGRRAGKPGVAYQNRSDLNGSKIPLPTTAPSAQYGEGAKLQAAQAAVPMGPSPVANIPQGPLPGAAGPLNRPSERPDEPITAGLPTGAGPGPESLDRGPGFSPDDADKLEWAKYLPTLELLANLPSASVATRNFVRRLRGAIPPGTGV